MQAPTVLYEAYLFTTSFFGWRDFCEIVFFTAVIYYFSLWLNQDTTKNLLALVYGYITTLVVSHILQLTAITFFLLYFSPFALLLLIIMHQETLQRNFITLKKVTIKKNQLHDDWLEVLFQTCLQTINKNKSVTMLIEQQDILNEFLNIPFNLSTQINTEILNLLIDSESYNDNRFILLTNTGKLLGINVECKQLIDSVWFDASLENYDSYKQKSFALTQKTDAVILSITPSSRKFLLVYNGKIVDHLQASVALQMLKKILITDPKKGFVYDTIYKNHHKQI